MDHSWSHCILHQFCNYSVGWTMDFGSTELANGHLCHLHVSLFLSMSLDNKWPMWPIFWLRFSFFFSVDHGCMGFYDPSEIYHRGNLKKHIKFASIRLMFHLVHFFIYLYIVSLSNLKFVLFVSHLHFFAVHHCFAYQFIRIPNWTSLIKVLFHLHHFSVK